MLTARDALVIVALSFQGAVCQFRCLVETAGSKIRAPQHVLGPFAIGLTGNGQFRVAHPPRIAPAW